MKNSSIKTTAIEALWRENPSLTKLMGICPIIAMSSSVSIAIGLGLATLIVIITSNIIASAIRQQLNLATRVPSLIFIIATMVTALEMLMQVSFYGLFELLGIFLPLIVVNQIVLMSAESSASQKSLSNSVLDGFLTGLGFLLVLVLISSIRELIGNGSLFDNMEVLFGSVAKDWVIHPFGNNFQFRLLLMPPGALLIFGVVIAAKNTFSKKPL
ncbi:MAG: electron transport complex subunit RsxE [Porticoccaceae bacterium]|nr:electron transport complex subunit RsxE [Porticoccaceae bacterium]